MARSSSSPGGSRSIALGARGGAAAATGVAGTGSVLQNLYTSFDSYAYMQTLHVDDLTGSDDTLRYAAGSGTVISDVLSNIKIGSRVFRDVLSKLAMA